MKLYIAVLDKVPEHMVPVLVAHAVLGAHITFIGLKDDGDVGYEYYSSYNAWLSNSFRKVVLRVNLKEFTKISEMNAVYLAHESTTLNGEDSCAIVCPRTEYPNVIKFAKMWQPKYTPSVVDLITDPNGFDNI